MLSPARLALPLVALVMALAAPVSAMADPPTTIPDSAIPDANLRTWIKGRIKVPINQEIPLATAEATKAQLANSVVAGPVADLTGLEYFTNATKLSIPSPTSGKNTYSDLTPLAGLTHLATVSLQNAEVTDLSPLAGSAATLTGILAANDAISDLSTLPSLPAMSSLALSGNQIVDVSPLLSKLDPTKLSQVSLEDNRITDASALVPLGLGANPLGNWTNSNTTLLLAGNRIADFSAFSAWNNQLPPSSMTRQTVYAGNYRPGGITLPLKSAVPTSTPTVAAGQPGAFDPATSLLTLTGTTPIDQITVGPNWTVVFSAAPGVTDPTAPAITGTPVVGTLLQAQAGSWIDGLTCTSTDYQWYRDDVAIAKIPYLDGQPRPTIGSTPTLGDGGTFASYVVQPQDAGHRLSVRVLCGGSPAYSRSVATDVVGTDAGAPLTPTIQPLEGRLTLGAAYAVEQPRSYTLGDPTPTRLPFYIGAVDADKKLIPPADLTVTVDPGTGTSLAPGDSSIEGTGAVRTLVLKASQTGTQSNIAIRVTAPTGESKTLTLSLKVSPATTPTSIALLGFSDSSSAISVGGGYLLVADDEGSDIGLYDTHASGREKRWFHITTRGDEIDWEASARKGDTVYWVGSHGNDKDGLPSPGRNSLQATTVTGTGASATLAAKGAEYQGLRDDLIAWDREHGDRLGFFAATQSGVQPELPGGFDVEGAELSPDDSELYLGFRSPLLGRLAGGKAIIVPVKNVEDLTTTPSGEDTRKAEFDEPILLDLEGQSIREMRKNAAGEYLIVSGESGVTPISATHQILWVWDGDRAHQPVKLSTTLGGDVGNTTAAGFWEGIGEMPSSLASGQQVGLLMDQGDDDLYGLRETNKKDFDYWSRKSRYDVATIAPPVITQFAVTDPGAFPAQPANTIGSPRTVTITNDSFTGLNRVSLTRARVVGADSVSRSDFLVSLDDCSGETLEKGESCDIGVRYAPSRTNTTSTAQLEISGNVPGGTTTIPLTGTSTDLPKGDQGDKGDQGETGDVGPQGTAGVQGAKGDAGANGLNGAKGDKGDSGPAGRDGRFSFAATRAPKVRRGKIATLSFKVRNLTTSTARSLKAKASLPKLLKASGLKAAGPKALRAGRAGTIEVTFRVGRTAKVGTHSVHVTLTVDGATVTRTVKVRVTR